MPCSKRSSGRVAMSDHPGPERGRLGGPILLVPLLLVKPRNRRLPKTTISDFALGVRGISPSARDYLCRIDSGSYQGREFRGCRLSGVVVRRTRRVRCPKDIKGAVGVVPPLCANIAGRLVRLERDLID